MATYCSSQPVDSNLRHEVIKSLRAVQFVFTQHVWWELSSDAGDEERKQESSHVDWARYTF